MSIKGFSRFPQCVCHLALTLMLATAIPEAEGGDEFDNPPISYSHRDPSNAITGLQKKIDDGDVDLEFRSDLGYLPSLLDALAVPVESQTLVFSKTSLQRHRISPRTPRAIYFGDELYIGYCHSGEVLEVSVADTELGTVFYTLDQKPRDAGRARERPRFVRESDACLTCHSSSRTENVPGHVLRSLFADASGQPIFSAGSFSVDHTTPLENRWGGWYVTGSHGQQSHLGNLIVGDHAVPANLDTAKGQNVTRLDGQFPFDASKYLTPHSDLVALMILGHQVMVHNRITKASFEARQALAYEQQWNQTLGNEPGHRLESVTRRLQNASRRLVEALLFVGEARLNDPIRGTSGYAEWFSTIGPTDRRGRSLRELDLTSRMMKYPCSYLIYSSSFDELPEEMLDHVWRRLWDVLDGGADPSTFVHLSKSDRRAIIEIVGETKSNVPDYWR